MASRVSRGGQRHDNCQRLLEVCGSIELAGGISYDDVGLAIRGFAVDCLQVPSCIVNQGTKLWSQIK